MKRSLLIIAAAAALTTSCSKSELADTENFTTKTPIEFNAYAGRTTKAAELDATGLQSKSISLYGVNTTGAYNAASAFTKTIDNVALTFNNGWATATPVFWPTTDNISFFAYVGNAGSFSCGTSKDVTFSYTVGGVASQEDLMVADKIDQTKVANSTNPVTLNFKHILSQISFKAKAGDVRFKAKVTKIEIKGAKNSGVFTYNVADETTAGSWGTLTGSADYVYSNTSSSFITDAAASITGDNGNLMLMPNADLTGVTIEISYQFFDLLTDLAIPNLDLMTKTITLDSSDSWAMGKKLTYVVTLPIDANAEIDFEVTADSPWDTTTPDKEK